MSPPLGPTLVLLLQWSSAHGQGAVLTNFSLHKLPKKVIQDNPLRSRKKIFKTLYVLLIYKNTRLAYQVIHGLIMVPSPMSESICPISYQPYNEQSKETTQYSKEYSTSWYCNILQFSYVPVNGYIGYIISNERIFTIRKRPWSKETFSVARTFRK